MHSIKFKLKDEPHLLEIETNSLTNRYRSSQPLVVFDRVAGVFGLVLLLVYYMQEGVDWVAELMVYVSKVFVDF